MTFYEELELRGLVENISNPELIEKINEGGLSFYVGYDPTAKSLQIGNLFPVITMMRFQNAGHTPYALIGGATGMIGDPSGKSAERVLLDEDTLNANIAGQKAQLERFLDFDCGKNSAVLVNNYDWMKNFSFLEFMRDVGKRFRLSEMLAKDSVKSRLNSDAGISFTEFSYQVLQSYDFSYLNKHHNVTLQIGGSDQWGNITAGIDLTRKQNSNQVFGLVVPLVTDSNGKKFGKSEGGTTVFLDADITSPYQMYQYLLNTDDAIVIRYLKYFTFFTLEEIKEFEIKLESEPHLRAAQKALASSVVGLVHGEKGIDSALRATSFFFGGKIENVTDKEVESIFCDIPSITIPSKALEEGMEVLEMLAQTSLFKSKGEARRSVTQKGVSINNTAIEDVALKLSKDLLASESSLVVRKGKKNYCVVKFI